MNNEALDDASIAATAHLKPIAEIAAAAGVPDEALEPYGRHQGKIDVACLGGGEPTGAVVLVSAMSPTPAGEGKSTVTVGLGDALAAAGHRTMIALREPSLGPVFGLKGGATGGGNAQIVPMVSINLHFTGDFHAITSANNLLAAMVDNHLHHGNALDLDPESISFKRVLDVNDRALRRIRLDSGGGRETGFDITAASEVMAVLCLARDMGDLKARLGRITVGFTRSGLPVTAGDLEASGAMAMLLRDALKPNLVQTIAGTPALVHGGPFANIAHGCNSAIATDTARRLADVVVTEAGFGADLGAEKFLDIKARAADCAPTVVVLVATVRALKMHGGRDKADLAGSDPTAVAAGLPNLARHVRNVRRYGYEPVVALNRFGTDGDEELAVVENYCADNGVRCAITEVHARGAAGGAELARHVGALLGQTPSYRGIYPPGADVEEQIEAIVRQVYGGDGVEFAPEARAQLERIRAHGWERLPVCIAKTQYSFSDDPSLLGAPSGFTVRVRELVPKTGAGFVVALTGTVMTMPGLPAAPAAERMDVHDDGTVAGLF
ncbi:formate--tetrahydrofolate ligase [Zhihengliuella halotolerans]|uniref:Formate--tetrahydrofolate ligase n=1 Tax=Zhihengliuella halotolerans TaxID=370736 RepID=A0A4Q8AFP1_9MICC|nr:formate--tetrahydrofolate ligase [Zhihengliuella halotolerans]RZU63140.1 formate-tetrahydrofolate ligase [Zhihengliuella halotolerans]